MDTKDYFWLTRKKEPKTKPKSRPLPKATQKYLEAEATLKEELTDLANKAWSLDRYDQAEELGYRIERYHPDVVLSGYVINLIKERLARIEDGTDQTISTN